MAKTSTFRMMALASFLSYLVNGCSSGWKTIRQGNYEGTPYVVQERDQGGLFSSTNSLDWRIRLGNISPVPVNANTTDWGPPYSTDIYGSDAYLFIDTKDTAYNNVPFMPATIGMAHTMLYVPPSVLNEEEFEKFYEFMKAEWPGLSKSFASNSLRGFPHIIGLVYGRKEKYIRDFKGRHDGRAMRLRIENDGRVRLINDDEWRNENYSGIFYQLQMPGKRLLLDGNRTNGGLTNEELTGFRDKGGVLVGQQFTIELTNWASDMEKAKETVELLSHKWHATHMQAGGQRQPLEQGEDGSYLWFKWGDILEESDRGVAKPGSWSYDAVTRTITVLNDSTRTIYNLHSVSETELVLEQTDTAMDTVGLVLRKVE